MTRFTHSGPSISRKTWLQAVVSLTVRSAAYVSLIGNMADGTLLRLVRGLLRMWLGSSIGLVSGWLQQYGSSCVILIFVILLLRWAWKLT